MEVVLTIGLVLKFLSLGRLVFKSLLLGCFRDI